MNTQLGPKVPVEEIAEQDLHSNAERQERRLDAEARSEEVLPADDQAPDPEASTEFTTADQEGIDAMHQSTDAIDPMDDREAKIEIARTTAEQTIAKMEGVQPGSDAEKANLNAMREARRTGSTNVDGLQSAPQPLDSTNTIDHPVPDVNSSGEPVVEVKLEEKKKGPFKRGLEAIFDRVTGKAKIEKQSRQDYLDRNNGGREV